MDVKVDTLSVVGGNSNFHCHFHVRFKFQCTDDRSKYTVERNVR